VARPTGKSGNVPLVFTVSTRVTCRMSAAAEDSAIGGEKRNAPATAGAPTQTDRRERRTYKGAVYEKGEDGQWHLQHD
jgi:hypothetical protein